MLVGIAVLQQRLDKAGQAGAVVVAGDERQQVGRVRRLIVMRLQAQAYARP